MMSHPLPQLEGRTPYKHVTRNTPDISEYLDFSWYAPVWYYDNKDWPGQKATLGRWLGVVHRIRQGMCYWVLAKDAQELVRSTVVPISEDELRDPTLIKRLAAFDTDIEIKLGKFEAGTAIGDIPEGTIANTFTRDEDEEVFHPLEPDATAFEIGEIGEDLYDYNIASEVILPQGENHITAKVIARKRDADGAPVGKRNNNPILDTRVYEVQFPDGNT